MRLLALYGAACLAVAALSLLLVPAAPGYDAWAWLLWGRESLRLELDTVAGPAFKPLPVAVAALLAPAGGAAPELWLLLARAGAVAAVVLAVVAARRLGAGPFALLAGAGVLLTGGFVRHAAVGDAEPLLVALVLGAFVLALDGRHRWALAVAGLAALVRPEVWPFLAAYGLWRWREDRAVVTALAVAVPAAWFLPELAGSGELLRSTDRARIPNPGQPATADVPALETLAGAASVVLVPAVVLALFARGRALLPALAGAGWVLLVAAMSQAGFSGEPRYLVPGAALVAVTAAVGAARLPRPALAAAALLLAAFAVPRAADIADLGPRLDHQRALVTGLERAIAGAGGPKHLLTCGRPAVGRYRGTLLAWHLDVPKRVVRADGHADQVTFRSRLVAGGPVSPAPARHVIARTRTWEIRADCSGLWHAVAP
jgi:hypothetical protein